ncbi:ATPase [Salmonella enterica subsp. houtenae]|nr:ATPase [Salmonella enterica subsp. houtenae]ECI4807499.1 ATPase [Salmonella enterica subsp. houtenae]
MSMKTNPRIILTGGPCAGKSTLLHALKKQGFYCQEESGRTIIQDQTRISGSGLPSVSPLLFAELMLALDIRGWHQAQNSPTTVFYDRGIPDIAGYLTLAGETAPDHLINAIYHFRYAPTVILLPPWRAIYHQDSERKQSWDEAVRTYEAMIRTYQHYGYQLYELPFASVNARMEQLIDKIRFD